jgi:hypothetical protein
VATENVDMLTGTADKCPVSAHGIPIFEENKVTGTITGGTATALIGGTLKRKTCRYLGDGASFIELLPGTVAKY